MDFVILDGDQAVFLPQQGAATVTPFPGIMRASGPATSMKLKACVEGDESKVRVPGVPYFTPVYSVPGMGQLEIQSLGVGQTASSATSGNKAFILKGATFHSKFTVTAPATTPAPASTPDPMMIYTGGVGNFETKNFTFKAS
ncbi:MAG: hypothetical protein AAF585_18250 [Verrucomicrobiota bacterium]